MTGLNLTYYANSDDGGEMNWNYCEVLPSSIYLGNSSMDNEGSDIASEGKTAYA